MPPSYLKQWIEAKMHVAQQYAGNRDRGGDGLIVEHVTSVQILCSVIRAYPYDLPTFMPSVLSAVVRHSFAPAPLRKIVSKTIQDFKYDFPPKKNKIKIL